MIQTYIIFQIEERGEEREAKWAPRVSAELVFPSEHDL
jgi:hypothetical protein